MQQNGHNKISRLDRWQRLALIALLIPLAIYIISAFHIRYMADDYCMLVNARQFGVLGTIMHVYRTWAGSYSTVAIMSVTGLLGAFAEPIELVVALAAWWLLLLDLFKQAAKARTLPRPPWIGAMAATLLCLATLSGAPNIVQSVYWTNGRVAYFLPIVLMTTIPWLLVRSQQSLMLHILIGFLAFILSGFAITYSLTTVCFFALSFVVLRQFPAKRYLGTGLIAALIGLAIFMLAPGNSIRQSHFPEPDLLFALTSTLTSSGAPLLVSLLMSPIATIGMIALPFGLARYFDQSPLKQPLRIIVFIPLAVFLLVSINFGAAYYAVSEPPPGRVWILPQYITYLGLVTLAYTAGLVTRRTPASRMPGWMRGVAWGLFVAIVASTAFKSLEVYRALEGYAVAWDQRDLQLSSAKPQDGIIATPRFNYVFGLSDLSTDGTSDWNSCIAAYYGLEGVIGVDDPAELQARTE